MLVELADNIRVTDDDRAICLGKFQLIFVLKNMEYIIVRNNRKKKLKQKKIENQSI